jgi:excisionase family DNA binding protein
MSDELTVQKGNTAAGSESEVSIPDGPPSPWMPPEEAARYMSIAVGTLRNWTSARFVPFVKRGGIVRYHRPTIDRWLARGGCPGRSTMADQFR